MNQANLLSTAVSDGESQDWRTQHVHGFAPAIVRKPNSLTDKILAANRFAEANHVIKGLRFGIDGDGTVVLANHVKFRDPIVGAKAICSINKALDEMTTKFIKENEAEIRKILGRKR